MPREQIHRQSKHAQSLRAMSPTLATTTRQENLT